MMVHLSAPHAVLETVQAALQHQDKQSVDTLHLVVDPAQLVASASCTAPEFERHIGSACEPWPPDSFKAAVQQRLAAVLQPSLSMLATAGVTCIAVLCVTSTAELFRFGWQVQQQSSNCASAASESAPRLSNGEVPSEPNTLQHSKQDAVLTEHSVLASLEPPQAALLEAEALPELLSHIPSHANQLHSFLKQVWSACCSCVDGHWAVAAAGVAALTGQHSESTPCCIGQGCIALGQLRLCLGLLELLLELCAASSAAQCVSYARRDIKLPPFRLCVFLWRLHMMPLRMKVHMSSCAGAEWAHKCAARLCAHHHPARAAAAGAAAPRPSCPCGGGRLPQHARDLHCRGGAAAQPPGCTSGHH